MTTKPAYHESLYRDVRDVLAFAVLIAFCTMIVMVCP
jgi:hypothetical protein